jgi:hypothetical protein
MSPVVTEHAFHHPCESAVFLSSPHESPLVPTLSRHLFGVVSSTSFDYSRVLNRAPARFVVASPLIVEQKAIFHILNANNHMHIPGFRAQDAFRLTRSPIRWAFALNRSVVAFLDRPLALLCSVEK